MRALISCPTCRRLHRLREAQCPFCSFAYVVVAAAVLPFSIACRSPQTDVAPSPSASASASEITSASSSPAPNAVASLTPSAIASLQQAVAGRDSGVDAGLLAVLQTDSGKPGDINLLDPGTGIGMYGGVPRPSTAPGVVTVVAATTLSQEDARTVAGMRNRARYCYERGLAVDPKMSGNVTTKVDVAADGTAKVTKKGGSGLSSDVEQCTVTGFAHTTFTAGAVRSFDLTTTATPKP